MVYWGQMVIQFNAKLLDNPNTIFFEFFGSEMGPQWIFFVRGPNVEPNARVHATMPIHVQTAVNYIPWTDIFE